MECPKCGKISSVIDMRRTNFDAVRRRRECAKCKIRFTTYERLAKEDETAELPGVLKVLVDVSNDIDNIQKRLAILRKTQVEGTFPCEVCSSPVKSKIKRKHYTCGLSCGAKLYRKLAAAKTKNV